MLELLTNAQMAEADRLTVAGGIASINLMENAGRAAANAAARFSPGRRILVVAGTGNNGGDGFVAGRILAQRGFDVRLIVCGDRARIKGDAAVAFGRWKGRTETASHAAIGECDLIVDALFGAGLDRAIEGAPRGLVDAINASGIPVLAIDLPSGVNGTTGEIMGVAVKASRTVTFFRSKLGHVLLPGRLCCGTTGIADIGIPAGVLERIRVEAFANEPRLWSRSFPRPAPDAHKYARGHAVIRSGGLSSTGAARLAARGALRAGAGLVTIASPREALPVNAAASLAVMVRPVDGVAEFADFLSDKRRNAVVIGPGAGVGRETRAQALAAVASGAAVVLDADALTSFAGDLETLAQATARCGKCVLTPHAGEFSRLFSALEGDIAFHSKTEKARAAALKTGAIVLLKGADTVVAAPDGRVSIATNAPASLATAGSGDVLAGIIAGLLAQGMPPFEAASAAVWLHGEAANAFGPGLISEDLPETLPAVYRRLFELLDARKEERF